MDALRRLWTSLRHAGRLAVGVPDYDAFVAHIREHHPDRTPPTYAEFFRERQDARYGRGRVRCC